MRARARQLGIATVALAATLAVCTPGAGAGQRKRVIVAPASGQVVRAAVVEIVVRAEDAPGALMVRLNGSPVESDFGETQKGLRTLKTSLDHGLRKGRNTLFVRVRAPGKRDRTETVRFVVKRRRPLVGAGRDRRVPVGSVVSLRGRVVGAKKGEAIRWRRVTAAGKVTNRPLALLSKPDGMNASFDATTLGRFRVRLAAGSGDDATSDTTEFTVVPATPLVDVDTMATRDGKPGTLVGTGFYPTPEPDGYTSAEKPRTVIHVLVLDRATLAFVSNKSYVSTDRLTAALDSLTDDRLVIVALRTPTVSGTVPITGSVSLATALTGIGFPSVRTVGGPLSDAPGGTVSAIGVPGMRPGEAEVNTNPAGGGMTGYLTPDQYFEYRYISPELRTFQQERLPDTCSDCRVGYVVSDIDPYLYTDGKTESRMFETNPQTGTGAARFDKAQTALDEMADFLASIPGGHLVRIAVQSHPAAAAGEFIPPIPPDFGSTTAGSAQTYRVMAKLADAVARAGGTRNGFNRTAQRSGPGGGQPVYSLLGWAGAGEGNGAESALDVDGADIYSLLNARVRRNRLHMFRPVRPSFRPVSEVIDQLVVQPPKPAERWPVGLADAEALSSALTYIGGQVPRLGCDPRSVYWLEVLTEADALSIKDDVDLVTMPASGDVDPCTGTPASGFTEAQLGVAARQLKKELGWAGKTRDFLAKRSSPFANGGLESWADAQTIADQIYESARPAGGQVDLAWVKFTEILLKMVAPVVGPLSSEMSELMELGVWIAGSDDDGRPTGDEVRVKADELGAKFVEQADAAKATSRQLGDIIISDPVKLRVVGSNANCVRSATCPPAYEVARPADQAAAAATFYRGVERTAYQELLPLGYRFTFLNPYSRDRQANPRRYQCVFQPFPDWPAAATTAWLLVLSPEDPKKNLFQTIVVTAVPNSGTHHAQAPPAGLLRRMLGPVSRSNDPDEGGLGMTLSELSREAKHWGWIDENAPSADSKCTWDFRSDFFE